jgi:uncharacterized protein (TIGR03790 family)
MICWRALLYTLIMLASTARLWAGGGPLNVVVVVNQNSTRSIELGNYYCEQRGIPPQNLLRVNWPGGNVEWTKTEFETAILTPLLAMLSARQLTNQIDYVVLCMDLPYRVVQGGLAIQSGMNSSTTALFYGFKPDFSVPSFGLPSCNLPISSSNSYAGSEGIFRATPPSSSNSFLVTMLTSSNLAEAKQIVDRSVASDASFPIQPVYLGHSDDRLRNIRYWLFDDAIFNTRLRANFLMQSTNINDPNSLGTTFGYQNGVQWAPIGTGIFAPGAMADNLTSYSGQIFEQPNVFTAHVTALAFLNAGASGSYGTVVEPCGWLQKFPSPQNYFYQARGFSLAECYYQSVTNPHQGLLVGEPLAAPFAQPAAGVWNTLPANSVLSGTTNLALTFTAADPLHPVSQVDLFIDGTYLSTVTNIPPRQNNVLNVSLNGHAMNYSVPFSATLKSVTAGLTSVLNSSSNTTKVRAFAHGDRIELRSFDATKRGVQIPVTVSNSVGTASALTTFVSTPASTMLDTVAAGVRSYTITNMPESGDWLQLTVIKTNGQTVSVAVTNQVPGTTLADFARSLFTAVNSRIELLAGDGVVVEDINMHEDVPYNLFIYGTNDHSGEFNIRARNPGWAESQVQVRLRGSNFGIQPSGTNRLDENVSDLQPRTHLYINSGVINLPLNFSFNTTAQPDGFHELTAVAYEGSHVRTQKRVSKIVYIQNTSLAAAFTAVATPTNVATQSTLQFSIIPNTPNITKIELFSTGGALTNITGQSSALFPVSGTNLGAGLHPFYAIVTRAGGQQYRTETLWIRLLSSDAPFTVSISASPTTLTWPATPGRAYEVLSATDAAGLFQLRDSITASNITAAWMETNTSAPQRFYRVRTAN